MMAFIRRPCMATNCSMVSLSRRLILQVCFEIGKRCYLTSHCRSNHWVHELSQPFRFKVQGEGDTGRVSNGFKSVCAGRPCRAGDDLKRDQLIRAAFDDLVVAVDAPAARPFQALFEYRANTQWFARHLLNIDYDSATSCR